MAELQEANLVLIRALLHGENKHKELYLSALLNWIPDGSLSGDDTQIASIHGLIERFKATNPTCFALAFLDYLRAESEKILLVPPESKAIRENVGEKHISTENQDQTCLGSRSFSKFDASSAPSEQHLVRTKVNVPRPTAKSHTQDKESTEAVSQDSYHTNFPALGSARSDDPQKSVQLRVKPTRRVNPTRMENPVVDSAFALAKVGPSNPDQMRHSTSRSAPLKVDMDALMQRFEKKAKAKQKKFETGNQTSNRAATVSVHCAKDSTPVCTHVQPIRFLDSTVMKLMRFGSVHAKLIKSKLVPSLIGELGYLFGLLSSGQSTEQQFGDANLDQRLFHSASNCIFYACIVMEQLGRVLDSVGEQLLSALIQHPAIAQCSPSLLQQIKGSLASQQAAALHSFKTYKVLNAQNAPSYLSTDLSLQPCKRQEVIGMPISLPFLAARDSRNNFKSRESQKLYNNRELCRDHFYAIIREAVSSQNAFGFNVEACFSKIQEGVRSLMMLLLVENYHWFTDLFLQQFIQVAMCGETDPVVSGLARQDPTKLQRLHDRLTVGSRNTLASLQTFKGSGYQANGSTDYKCIGGILRLSPQTHSDTSVKTGLVSDFTSFFPQTLWVYIWIIEAADSYRLSVQMIWGVKSRLCKLTQLPRHSRDAAEIASVLTQRVLSLKALAGLLGFLCCFPGAGAVPLSGTSGEGCEWGLYRTDPPIDVVEILENAVANETVLLTLPWVLDYLRLSKADEHILSLPFFQRSITALQKLYEYPLLDPQNDGFGVASLCILALLDKFFEFMDIPTYNVTSYHKTPEPVQFIENVEDSSLKTASSGLDRMIGVVDGFYIQHCCSMLVDLRVLLTDDKNQQVGSHGERSSVVPGKSLRKITPVQHSKSSQHELEDPSTIADHYLQLKLQQTFFGQRPELQRLVDFVVDTTAVNAARAASLQSVPPALEKALRVLNSTVFHNRQATLSKEYLDEAENGAEAMIENIITTAIQEALGPGMEYAKKHTLERTSEALSALAAPDEAPYVLGIAARIAADAAGSAACKKTLANISCDIRKHITLEVETWRRNLQNSAKVNMKEKGFQVKTNTTTNSSNTGTLGPQNIYFEGKETADELSFFNNKQSVNVLADTDDVSKFLFEQKCQFSSLLSRVLCCCAAVCEYCSSKKTIDDQRHALRVKLAAVCTAIEGMLSLDSRRIPAGGFDALVQHGLKDIHAHFQFESDKPVLSRTIDSEFRLFLDNTDVETQFRIERGLAQRCIALAIHFCLLLPFEAFGYKQDSLKECSSTSSHTEVTNLIVGLKYGFNTFCQTVELHNDLEKLNVSVQLESETGSRNSTEGQPDCLMINQLGGLMLGIVSMWESLTKHGICKVSLFVTEFLAPWRWVQALTTEPWKASGGSYEVVICGVAKVLQKLINMNQEAQIKELVCSSLKKLSEELLAKDLTRTSSFTDESSCTQERDA